MCQMFSIITFDKHGTLPYGKSVNMNTHRIHRVAKLTGLSKDVIRIWERRHRLVVPSRSANRYREYSDEEVALLRFLKAQMEQGATIGALADEGRAALVARMHNMTPVFAEAQKPHARLVEGLLALLDPFDKVGFERKLNGAVKPSFHLTRPSSGFCSPCNNVSGSSGTRTESLWRSNIM